MGRDRERGEGKITNLVWLAAIFLLAYASWNVGPLYFANYSLADKMNEIARLSRQVNDEKINDALMKYVYEENLGSYIQRNSFKIQTMDQRRAITCRYSRTANVLPGFTKTFDFDNRAEQLLPY